ncbi:MAG: phosphatase PAP2 family protein [Bacteroidales bacterium]|jgi:membrane-associated phospholipid phosphatase|nr:phosphatase PAP2 family protein [Bacteroidales bacterium]
MEKKNRKERGRLLAFEYATLLYACITAGYISFFTERLEYPWLHYAVRLAAAGWIFFAVWLDGRSALPVLAAARRIFPFAMLGYWYPETSCFNCLLFEPLDRYFMDADFILFGCQPSIEFSRCLPQAWVSELMYFGYFSYYFIFFGTVLWCWFFRKAIVDKAILLFVGSFYCFYLIFILFPAAGPQYYFSAPANEAPDGYLFCHIMRFFQAVAEKPTGAFPSSHVGITLIAVLFIFKHCRELFRYALPLFLILMASTVYIKAHYLIDVAGGLAAGGLCYLLFARRLFR